MIYQVTMYAAKCDSCGKDVKLGGGEYSALADKECVEEEMRDSDFHMDGDKQYCPNCWSYDDNDNVIIKPPKTI